MGLKIIKQKKYLQLVKEFYLLIFKKNVNKSQMIDL